MSVTLRLRRATTQSVAFAIADPRATWRALGNSDLVFGLLLVDGVERAALRRPFPSANVQGDPASASSAMSEDRLPLASVLWFLGTATSRRVDGKNHFETRCSILSARKMRAPDGTYHLTRLNSCLSACRDTNLRWYDAGRLSFWWCCNHFASNYQAIFARLPAARNDMAFA